MRHLSWLLVNNTGGTLRAYGVHFLVGSFGIWPSFPLGPPCFTLKHWSNAHFNVRRFFKCSALAPPDPGCLGKAALCYDPPSSRVAPGAGGIMHLNCRSKETARQQVL